MHLIPIADAYGFSAQKIYDEMVRLCEGIEGVEIEMQKDIPHVGVIKTGCQGLLQLDTCKLNHTDIPVCIFFRRRTVAESWANCTPWTSCRSSVLPPWR